MGTIHGLATGVYAENLGDSLATSVTITTTTGPSTLTVHDVADFAEEGGTLLIGGTLQWPYSGVDDDTATIFLATPLRTTSGTLTFAVDTEVAVYDAANNNVATTYRAVVANVDGFDSTGPVEAVVPDQLVHALQQMMTDPGVSIVMQQDGSEWQVVGILGRAFSLATLQYLQGGMTTRQSDDQPGVDILGADSGIPGLYLYGAAGGVFGAGAQGVVIVADGSQGLIQFYSGIAGETAGRINPGVTTISGQQIPFLDFYTADIAGGGAGSHAAFRLLGTAGLNGPTLNMLGATDIFANDIDCDDILASSLLASGNVEADGHLSTPNAPTTTSATNARIGSAGIINLVTSLTEHKLDAKILTVDDVRPLLSVDPNSWFDRSEHESNGKRYDGLRRIPGALAEHVEELFPLLADYDDQGVLQGVHNDRVGWLLIPLLRELAEQCRNLTGRVETLESELTQQRSH